MKHIVQVGDVVIGNGHIVVQTMCNTHTDDVEGTVAQCLRLADAGAEIVRITVPGLQDVPHIAEIRRRLRAAGCNVPLVADIHFSAETAIACASVVEKVRINPGNFHKDHEKARERFAEFLAACKAHGTAVRIGLNHGSLGAFITERYGNTPRAMAEAAMEWIRMAVDQAFFNVVVSLKASNTVVMVEAYRLLQQEMEVFGHVFPLHVGVTEAGNGDSGRIKSCVGIASVLSMGMGDTVRVSLTEDPEAELPVARYLSDRYGRLRSFCLQSRTPDGGLSDKCSANQNFSDSPAMSAQVNATEIRTSPQTAVNDLSDEKFGHQSRTPDGGLSDKCSANQNFSETEDTSSFGEPSRERMILEAACEWGPRLLSHEVDDVVLPADWEPGFAAYVRDEILQAARRRFYKPEYIACPGCGRTMYNLQKAFEEVKAKTAHLKNVVIAVMGCIVNGPGEMADADWGYVGEGNHKVSIYKGSTPLLRHIPEEEAADRLVALIEADAN